MKKKRLEQLTVFFVECFGFYNADIAKWDSEKSDEDMKINEYQAFLSFLYIARVYLYEDQEIKDWLGFSQEELDSWKDKLYDHKQNSIPFRKRLEEIQDKFY